MRRSKRSADCGPRPASLCSSDTEILRSLAMRSTSYSAQHFKSDTEVFLESCHRFKTDLIADQRLDRADMCPSTVAASLWTMRSWHSERGGATGKGNLAVASLSRFFGFRHCHPA